jgi:hypothetical protein
MLTNEPFKVERPQSFGRRFNNSIRWVYPYFPSRTKNPHVTRTISASRRPWWWLWLGLCGMLLYLECPHMGSPECIVLLISVYLAHYLANDTFPNATSLQYAIIGGLGYSLSFLTASSVAASVRISSTQSTSLICIFLFTISLIEAGFATRIWHLWLRG